MYFAYVNKKHVRKVSKKVSKVSKYKHKTIHTIRFAKANVFEILNHSKYSLNLFVNSVLHLKFSSIQIYMYFYSDFHNLS